MSKHKIKINGALNRTILEHKYFTCKDWSLKEVGMFWDSVTDYDDINESTYTYFRRFTNSWDMAKPYISNNMTMLDIQARTGKGTEFWFEKGVIKKSYVIDFSDFLLQVAKKRLEKSSYNCEFFKILEYDLPFSDNYFDMVACYETIEHIGNPFLFIKELSRVLKKDGIMIISCPNILWEPVHWIAAIINFHHSEGPHNFLKRKKLLNLFKRNNLSILKENTTILLPFNKSIFIKINEKLEKKMMKIILRLLGLRRTFILKKI